MTYGRQPQIDKDIDWVIDEDNNVLGYMKDPRTFVTTGKAIPSSESSSRTLLQIDDGKTLVCTGNPAFTVPSGLGSGFGVAASGACSFSAGSGTAVTDQRTTGAVDPWCALVQVGQDTYRVIGGKA